MSKVATESRRRSSAESRERLLDAAGELFAERGYDNTTVREVGQRADVDPALIARYFGSKSALYLASLQRGGHAGKIEPLDVCDAEGMQGLLDRVGSNAPTPTLYAALRPHEDSELQKAALDILTRRFLNPAEATARTGNRDQPQLRAEIATAALAGIVISRTSNAFSTLGAASSQDVGRLIADMLSALLSH